MSNSRWNGEVVRGMMTNIFTSHLHTICNDQMTMFTTSDKNDFPLENIHLSGHFCHLLFEYCQLFFSDLQTLWCWLLSLCEVLMPTVCKTNKYVFFMDYLETHSHAEGLYFLAKCSNLQPLLCFSLFKKKITFSDSILVSNSTFPNPTFCWRCNQWK